MLRPDGAGTHEATVNRVAYLVIAVPHGGAVILVSTISNSCAHPLVSLCDVMCVQVRVDELELGWMNWNKSDNGILLTPLH